MDEGVAGQRFFLGLPLGEELANQRRPDHDDAGDALSVPHGDRHRTALPKFVGCWFGGRMRPPAINARQRGVIVVGDDDLLEQAKFEKSRIASRQLHEHLSERPRLTLVVVVPPIDRNHEICSQAGYGIACRRRFLATLRIRQSGLATVGHHLHSSVGLMPRRRQRGRQAARSTGDKIRCAGPQNRTRRAGRHPLPAGAGPKRR